ncbi:MAG: SH3 domain-containing protein [Anaerolineales bacterium]|nr:SH3 domain-containing protein [Anaerolineales bacterium]
MNKRTFTASLVLALSMLACNLPAGGAATQTPIVITTTPGLPTETLIPTQTLIPTETPLPTFTPTPTIPIAWPLDKGVNCRLGPSTDWISIGSLLVGQTATIQGKNGDVTWWYVTTVNDPGKPCWVASSVTVTAGNLANLQVINPPIASVTDVSLKLDPKEIILPGCIGPIQPITIKGSITTNGPAKVEWHFETQQGGSLTVYTIEFKKAETQTIEGSFTPSFPAGDYWVKLIITKPNEKTSETKYKVSCP